MLGRLLRAALSKRASPTVDMPTSAHRRLMEAIVAAAQSSGQEGLAEQLAALNKTEPRCAAAHRQVGSHLGRLGFMPLALAQLEAALAIESDHAGTWLDLGNVHRLEGRIEQAAGCFRRALAIEPHVEGAHLGLAACEDAAGNTDAAVERLRGRVFLDASGAALQMVVELLDRRQCHDDAKRICRQVLEREPRHGIAHAALGVLLLKRDLQPAAALACFDLALECGYRDASLWSNRGIALQDLGRLDEALASYGEALALEPQHALARFHRGLARLMRGEFDAAWDDYELRIASSDRPAPPLDLPGWGGEPTSDAVLVYGEQGIGDEIMFASCIPDLLRVCPKVTIACNPKLESIFRRSFPATRVVGLAQAKAVAGGGAGECRRMVAIGTLPRHFRRTRSSFPQHGGYLTADPALVAEYRRRLVDQGPGLKVGISWRGGTVKTRQALRRVALSELSTLFALPGAQFVNLQYDSHPTDSELQPLIDAGVVVDWRDALEDYDRTAALVASLDVVVSVCTAVIHLAGALGRPTLIMAPYSPEWRYGIAGHDMPWYPSVHIERQRTPGEWGPVVAAVRERIVMYQGGPIDDGIERQRP